MFKGKKIDPTSVDTIIGETVEIVGEVKSQTSIQVDGKIKGKVECGGNIIVGEKGVIDADITSQELVISGTVNGNVHASEKLVIKSTGSLNGEIKTKSFVVDEGGSFLGKSSMEKTTNGTSTYDNKTDKKDAPKKEEPNKEDAKENKKDNDKK